MTLPAFYGVIIADYVFWIFFAKKVNVNIRKLIIFFVSKKLRFVAKNLPVIVQCKECLFPPLFAIYRFVCLFFCSFHLSNLVHSLVDKKLFFIRFEVGINLTLCVFELLCLSCTIFWYVLKHVWFSLICSLSLIALFSSTESVKIENCCTCYIKCQ